ncbi:MAG: YneF family protein [Bacilli bacterium]|jgi:uncharacterized protein YneF (UPF0154 family)|nr:YneF family protein [Bacilli bacterium]
MQMQDILQILVGLIAGLIIGYFVTQKLFKKQLAKNPPVNEKMIRAMYMSMGRKPSESQIKATMREMNKYK